MSHIHLPYGLVRKYKKAVNLILPKIYKEKFIFSKLPYLNNIEDPHFQNSTIDVINSREDWQKFLLGSNDIADNT